MRKREMETETETKNWKTKNQEMGDEGKHTMKKICYKMGIRHSIKDNLKNFADFYITCCIPVIPFSLSAHMLFYLSEESAWGRGAAVVRYSADGLSGGIPLFPESLYPAEIRSVQYPAHVGDHEQRFLDKFYDRILSDLPAVAILHDGGLQRGM